MRQVIRNVLCVSITGQAPELDLPGLYPLDTMQTERRHCARKTNSNHINLICPYGLVCSIHPTGQSRPLPQPSGTESRPALGDFPPGSRTCGRSASSTSARPPNYARTASASSRSPTGDSPERASPPRAGWRSTPSRGKPGWASAKYLRKTKTAQSSSTGIRPALACTYRVSHVHANGFLNGPLGRYATLAPRRQAQGRRRAGPPGRASPPRAGWRSTPPKAKPGWASAKYLRKITGK